MHHGIGRNQVIFGAGNERNNLVDFLFGVFNTHLLQNQADYLFLVAVIINGKIAREAQFFGVLAQHSNAHGVKRMYPHAAPRARLQGLHTLAHFLRGFVGKCDRQNARRIIAVFNQFGNFGGKGFGFTRSGTGYNQAGPAVIIYSFQLLGI